MTKDAKNLIVGLDIGTSKVVAVVAEVMPDGRHEVIGLGQHESKGLKKGVVVFPAVSIIFTGPLLRGDISMNLNHRALDERHVVFFLHRTRGACQCAADV